MKVIANHTIHYGMVNEEKLKAEKKSEPENFSDLDVIVYERGEELELSDKEARPLLASGAVTPVGKAAPAPVEDKGVIINQEGTPTPAPAPADAATEPDDDDDTPISLPLGNVD